MGKVCASEVSRVTKRCCRNTEVCFHNDYWAILTREVYSHQPNKHVIL